MASSNDSDPPQGGGQSDGLDDGSNIGVGRTAVLRRAIEQNVSATTQNAKPAVNTSSSTLSAPASGANSPKSSRETSPIRPSHRPVSTTSARVSRSRKNSQEGRQEFSPSRAPSLIGPNAPSIPSAAAVQRALSAAKPQLHPPAPDSALELPKPEKPATSRSGDTAPHWPVSPRLRSPPPASLPGRNTVTSPRKAEHDVNAPNISVKRPGPPTTAVSDSHLAAVKSDSEHDDSHPRTGLRALARGASAGSTLETVQEASLPATPAIGPAQRSYTGESRPDIITEHPREESPTKSQRTGGAESGSDSGGKMSGDAKSEDKDHLKAPSMTTAKQPSAVFAKRSFTNLNPNKAAKSGGEGSVRNMTVETETVSSVPQVALGAVTGDRGASGRGDGGSLRLKPSNETIRPKKEKKKATRKPTSINTGTVSSKADIFEAKVANAVDEANSSDSEETFVYESNPPDQPSRQQRRYHSRTPSQASMASQIDQHGRNRSSIKDGNQGVVGKRSMKFTNNTYNNTIEGDGHQSIGRGNGRVSGTGATPRHHHHIGRHGRGGHTSIFDGDSPFTQAGRSPKSATGHRLTNSRPSSPRNPSFKALGSPRKSMGEYGYDFDAEGADDERTPLVGSVRINRRYGRRPNSSSIRHVDSYLDERNLGFFGRYGACIIVTILLLILVLGAAAFVVALMKPLLDVSVKHLQNVLASEQEIMLDLHVKATNPNLFAITVADMDVNIFAKSAHIGSELEFEISSLGTRQSRSAVRRNPPRGHGIDEGNDPIEDPEGDSQTMLLGRIFEFDSPLIFESSPFKRSSSSSVGELRLAKPGNKTEEGGSARWERVLQHPFDLIVRGVLKYQLPLSSRMRSAPIGASVRVFPKDGLDEAGKEKTGKTTRPSEDDDINPPDPHLRDAALPQKSYRFSA